PSSSPQLPATRQEEIEALVYQLIAKALTQQQQTVITEEQEASTPLLSQPSSNVAQKQDVLPPADLTTGQQEAPDESEPPDEGEERLQRAYQELKAEGQRISGRTLAARAHVRRTTCNRWLVGHHPSDIATDTG